MACDATLLRTSIRAMYTCGVAGRYAGAFFVTTSIT
jgi:hypothetical protein